MNPEHDHYEDFLLDPDASEAERDAQRLRMVADSSAFKRMINRHYAHGLIEARVPRNALAREKRVRSAMRAIRASNRVRFAKRFGTAAAVLIALGLSGFVVFGDFSPETPSTPPVTEQPDPWATPNLVEVDGPFTRISGKVQTLALENGRYRVTTQGDGPSTLRFADRGTVVLSKGSVIELDRDAELVSVMKGGIGLESSKLCVDFDGSRTCLSEGIAVFERDASGLSAEIYRGQLRSEGEAIATSGQMLRRSGDGFLAEGSVHTSLPEWLAAGRSEEFVAEIKRLLGDDANFDTASWNALVTPMLANPFSREMLLEVFKGIMEVGLSEDDLRDLLQMVNESMLSRRERGNQRSITSEEYEAHVHKQMTFMSNYWATLTPEQRKQMLERAREMGRKSAEKIKER